MFNRLVLIPVALTALALTPVTWAQADTIKLVKGGTVIAKVREESDQGTIYNIYRTGIARAVFGTETAEKKNVKSVTRDSHPHRSFWRRAHELRTGTADEWVVLGIEARSKKLPGLARHAFVEALVRDPQHASALRELGPQWKALQAADPWFHAALSDKLKAYLELPDDTDRSAAAAEISKLGSVWPPHALERARRSAKRPKGRKEDVLLTLDSKIHAGGVYTLVVPESYDPWKPTPLLFGLHGGGAAGKDRTNVVGSGSSAMNFFEAEVSRLGWIAVCPTALRAPWADEANDEFVLAVLEEVCALYNIDRNRIYLAGHSMGGYGTWHFGPKYAHLWAAISPNAGGGRPLLQRLQDTQTGVYCYHGADDAVVGVSNDREVARQMREQDMDFVYCELPDSGHGWPDEVRAEMFDFFSVRRLAATANRSEKGKFSIAEEALSSFLEKPSKRELAAFGPLSPGPARADDAADLPRLLADLSAGGGRAERAASALQAMKGPQAVAAVAKVLSDEKQTSDARRFAATALGGMGDAQALKSLRKATLGEDLQVLRAAALALGKLADPDAAKSFPAAAQNLVARFSAKKSGSRMDFTDFEEHLHAAIGIADGVGESNSAPSLPALEILADALLFAAIDVPKSERAGHDPAIPRRLLAQAVVTACAKLGTKTTHALLDALASRPALGVAERALEAKNS